MSDHKAIVKSASVISVYTVISRITGFLRDVLIARFFGTGVGAQAFFVAFRIPNMLRDVLGEGAGSAAFVPVLSQTLARQERREYLRLVNSLFVLLAVLASLIAIFGILGAPLLIRLIAPGFVQDSLQFDLTVLLTRLIFPYLVLIILSAYLTSVSHSLKAFAAPAASSIVFNLVLAGLLIVWRGVFDAVSVLVLVLGVYLGGAGQVLVQLPPLKARGVDFQEGGIYREFWRQKVLHKIARLMGPRILGTSIYQLNVFVDTIFASLSFLVGEGAVAALYYANRIIQFPFAVFAVAITNAALPGLSVDSVESDMKKFNQTLGFILRGAVIFIIPVIIGLCVFAHPLTRAIFLRGSFTEESALLTSRAVLFYGLGLLGFVGVRFLSHGFYALQDTRTPVKTSGLALLLNILLNTLFIFIFHFGIAGLALASSLSAVLNFIFLYRLISRRTAFSFGREDFLILWKVVLASGAMVFLLYAGWSFFSKPATLVAMGIIAFSGGSFYLFLLKIFNVKEVRDLWLWLKKMR